MGKKQRVVFVTLIALVMAAALISAFSLTLFHETPPVLLPSLSPSAESLPPTGQPQGDYQRLDVTVDTVQQVIATLNRPESYTRTVTVELLGREDAWGTLTAQVDVDGGWTQSEAALPDGRVSHTIIGDGSRYVWYGGETSYRRYDADDRSADLAQRVPTYEDVLDADAGDILAAGYELQGGLPCVYVAVSVPGLGYVERYWVSVNTGLLVYATSETAQGQVFYRMSAFTVETPAAPGLTFALPDGQVMHSAALPD